MSYADLEAFELRAELENWHEQVVTLAAEYRQAVAACDRVWAEGIGLTLDQALLQVRRLRALLKLGAAA